MAGEPRPVGGSHIPIRSCLFMLAAHVSGDGGRELRGKPFGDSRLGLSAVFAADVLVCDPDRRSGVGYSTCGIKPGSICADPPAVSRAKWVGDACILRWIFVCHLYGDCCRNCAVDHGLQSHRDSNMATRSGAGGNNFR